MKKIFTLSAIALFTTVVLSSCIKDGTYYDDESYWLSRERGEVVYSSSTCNYYVVETFYGYTIIRAYGSYRPYERSIVYGDFGYRGTRDFYNRSSGYVFTGTVTDYRLSYTEAQLALDYYCPFGKGQRQFVKTDSSGK
jgi:hypothetical protein